jgi:hypothetical protein
MSVTRDQSVTVRCTTRERRALCAIADVEGRKLSEVIRELVRERAQRLGVWPSQAPEGVGKGVVDG